MLVIFWTGYGFFTFGIFVGAVGTVAAIVSLTLGERVFDAHPAFFGLGLIVAAIANWFVGRKLNKRPGLLIFIPPKGRRRVAKRRHTIFMLPMEYWSAAMLLWALYEFAREIIRF